MEGTWEEVTLVAFDAPREVIIRAPLSGSAGVTVNGRHILRHRRQHGAHWPSRVEKAEVTLSRIEESSASNFLPMLRTAPRPRETAASYSWRRIGPRRKVFILWQPSGESVRKRTQPPLALCHKVSGNCVWAIFLEGA